MPLGRERKRAAPFSFALPPLNFHGTEGRGGAGFGGSLPSVAALLVYACQRVGRASVLNIILLACAYQFSPTGGLCFRGFCTIDGGAFVGFMPLGQEGKRAEPFSFALPWLKGSGVWWIATLGGGALGMCIPAWREVERTELFFRACAVQFPQTGRR